MRSLTCKSHSAASKRAVIGRSRDFDTLLSEHLAHNSSRLASIWQFIQLILDNPAKVAGKQTGSSAQSIAVHKLTIPDASELRRSPFIDVPSGEVVSKSGWLQKNVKVWISESLRLYSMSRKTQSDAPSLSQIK